MSSPAANGLLGGIDLSSLRRPATKPSGDVTQLFVAAGLICPCGELIRDRGVQALKVAPSPQGPHIVVGAFHDRQCDVLKRVLATDPPIAIRAMEPLEWIAEPDIRRPPAAASPTTD